MYISLVYEGTLIAGGNWAKCAVDLHLRMFHVMTMIAPKQV